MQENNRATRSVADITRDVDLIAPTTKEESDALWAELRAVSPVVRSERHGGYWALTGYEEVCEAFRSWELFSSARTDPEMSSVSFTQGRVPLLVPEELDPPVWYAYRRVLAELLSPRASEALRPSVRRWCDHYIDRVIETGRCDFVRDLAVPVPASVMMDWLGFPEEDWLPFASTFHEMSAFPPGHPTREAAAVRYGEVNDGIRREIELRRSAPRDDALSWIVAAQIDGEPIEQHMLECLVFMVIGGGVDTTTSLTSAALVHLGMHRADRDALVADPSLLSRATEEFLRVYPPARTHTRTVTADTEVLGCPMHAGDRLVLSELSANFDERQFPDAHVFQIDRDPNRHVSFGMGLHRCPGSHLARIEFHEMISTVLSRMPDFELEVDAVEQYPSWVMVGGWSHVPATFQPGPRVGDGR